ncbi:MAG: hypothetical protein WBM54_15400 [Woeseia sp.]
MAVLASFFGNQPEQQAQDSDKLLHLFWNRTELKKEFANLRKEQFRLRDKIKFQEGEITRAGRRLANLESLLMNPEFASNALVHYQLRGLGQRCENKLAKFAEQLKQQHESKVRNQVLVAWNEERLRQRKRVESKLAEVQHAAQLVADRLRAEEARLETMPGILKIFRRSGINAQLEILRQELADAVQNENELHAKIESINNQRPPDNGGLDVNAKRSINFKIIAFAQQLFLQLGGSEFAVMVKETMERGVEAVKFGNDEECHQLIERIRKKAAALEQNPANGDELHNRCELIGARATFGSAQEVVPSPSSVATVFKFDDVGEVVELKGNLLGENYWGIARVLSR